MFVYTSVFGYFGGNYKGILDYELARLPEKLVITYFAVYVLVPRYLQNQAYIKFAAYFLTFSYLVIFATNVTLLWDHEYLRFYDPFIVLKYMIYTVPLVGLVAAIRLWQQWRAHQIIQERLKQEKLEAELSMLKVQLHPHFLLNTINNIYSLSLERSQAIPECLLKLSQVLNYMLYECSGDEVQLIDEIDLIRNYAALENLRHEDRLNLVLNISGDCDSAQIAPLMLLPFVENAFKHGVRSSIDSAWITIDIAFANGTLCFKVENSTHEDADRGDKLLECSGGIGLKNIRRRLDLTYSGRYSLEIMQDRDWYMTVLEIHLE